MSGQDKITLAYAIVLQCSTVFMYKGTTWRYISRKKETKNDSSKEVRKRGEILY